MPNSNQDNEDGALAAILLAAQSNPYVMAAVGVYKVVSAISDENWQKHVDDQLDHIRQELAIISRTVNQILKKVDALPDIIKRLLDENSKRASVKKIAQSQDAISIILGSQPLGKLIELNDQEQDLFYQYTKEIIDNALILKQWGPDSYIALGQAYSHALLLDRIIGRVVLPIAGIRSNFVEYMRKEKTRLEAYGNREFKKAWPYRKEAQKITGIKGWVCLGVDGDVDGSFMRYARYSGSIEKGFRLLKEIEDRNETENTRRLPRIKDFGPHFSKKFGWDANRYASGGALETANKLAGIARPYEKNAIDAFALSIALEKMITTIDGSIGLMLDA